MSIIDTLKQCRKFIEGFEDDETQKGIGKLLTALKRAETAAPMLIKAAELSLQHLEKCNDFDADSAEIGAEAIAEIRNALKFAK